MVGRLAQEPELKKTPSGKSVVSTSLAVQRDYKENGEKKADFFPIVVWGKSADNFHSWLKKGQLISVSGRLQRRDYENQQGQRVYVTEVVADSFQLLESRANREGQAGGGYSSAGGFAGNAAPSFGGSEPSNATPNFGRDDNPFGSNPMDISDDDLPF